MTGSAVLSDLLLPSRRRTPIHGAPAIPFIWCGSASFAAR
jgi:hypothetical protein